MTSHIQTTVTSRIDLDWLPVGTVLRKMIDGIPVAAVKIADWWADTEDPTCDSAETFDWTGADIMTPLALSIEAQEEAERLRQELNVLQRDAATPSTTGRMHPRDWLYTGDAQLGGQQ